MNDLTPTPRKSRAVYAWKEAQPFKRWVGDAQEIGERIDAIWESRNGVLTPLDLVEDARQENSPLHPNFEWDDVVAAREYRTATARNLLGAIVRTSINGKMLDNPVRAFVHVNNGPQEHYYMPVVIAMRDPDIRETVLKQALNELDRWKKKYADYQELARIVDAIDSVTLEALLEPVEV